MVFGTLQWKILGNFGWLRYVIPMDVNFSVLKVLMLKE